MGLLVGMVGVVILLSGKRKSGKDYCCTRLVALLEKTWKTVTAGVSHSLKQEYARIHQLDYAALLGDGPYKEKYRADMIRWGEEMRNKDEGYFCRATLPREEEDVDVLVVSDCRRPTDIDFYRRLPLKVIAVRVKSTEEVRRQRGWRFIAGVDDAASECGLDGREWDAVVFNDGREVDPQLEQLEQRVRRLLHEGEEQ